MRIPFAPVVCLALAACALSPRAACADEPEAGRSDAGPEKTGKTEETPPPREALPDEKPLAQPPPPSGEEEGFAMEPGSEPRLPRIRLEVSWVSAYVQSRTRYGRTGASNTIFPHEDVHVPRWNMGERGAIVLKLHRYVALGVEFVHVSSEGRRASVTKDVRWGGTPTEVPDGDRARGDLEIGQGNVSVRVVPVDSVHFRVEVGAGFAWSSYRFGLHPSSPLVAGPGGGLPFGSSRTVVAYFAPTLGTFFCWNLAGSPFALFVDQYSAYFSTRPGSIASYARAGVRIHLGHGIEIVAALFLMAGNVFDVHDRWENRAHGHRFRTADWTGGGPDFGLSFTY